MATRRDYAGPEDLSRLQALAQRIWSPRRRFHRAGWSDFDSQLSAVRYHDIMTTHPYRAQTDLVVVAPDGQWVASALGWYDEANRVGLVKPVLRPGLPPQRPRVSSQHRAAAHIPVPRRDRVGDPASR